MSAVLSRIDRNLVEIESLLTEGNNTNRRDRAVCLIDSSVQNLERIRPTINEETFNNISIPLGQLRQLCDETTHPGGISSESRYTARRIAGSRGRPKLQVSPEQLRLLHSQGHTAKEIAERLGCSASYVYNSLYKLGIKLRDRYSDISDQQLEDKVSELHNDFPNCGNEMMHGYLQTKGVRVQRSRLRNALVAVDPSAAANRWAMGICRRTYKVACPNSVWHMDGHMKLCRWGFVTHGCVDGFSRLIPYLKCTTSNKAEVVAETFIAAADKYGLPSRVRSDHGGENMLVAVLMNLLRGDDRASHITGESVHNQRIERLWRDVHKEVTSHFYQLFYSFEDEGILHPDSDIDKCALQFVYLEVINSRLEIFRSAWNKHRIRTENNKTPEQLWVNGMLLNMNSGNTATEEIFNDTEDLKARLLAALHSYNIDEEDTTSAQIPPSASVNITRLELNEEQKQLLTAALIPLQLKDSFKNCVTALKSMRN